MLGSHSLACAVIAKYGTEEQKQKYLPDLATGKRRSGIGLTEPEAGSDLQGIKTTARLDGDHYVINGTKTWITNARHADPLPVLCKTDPGATPAHKGISLIWVDGGTPGFTISKDLPKLGYKGTETCEVSLDDVRVPVENLSAASRGAGCSRCSAALETGRINVAARAVGNAQRAYDEALKYSRERQAFGEPISSFQAIQLKLADMATEDPGRAAARVVGGEQGRHRARASTMEAGMAKCSPPRWPRGDAGGHAHPRRLRLLEGVRRRAPLPRRAADGDRRGHQRHHAHGHRQEPYLGQGDDRVTHAQHAAPARPQARSHLYVPGDKPDVLAKALGRGADALIVDLEDAVAPSAKDDARQGVRAWLAGLPAAADNPVEVWVRTNSGAEALVDVVAVAGPAVTGFCVAKTESVDEIENVAAALDVVEAELGLPAGSFALAPLLESAAAVLKAPQIAAASRVKRLQVGEADLRADVGFTPRRRRAGAAVGALLRRAVLGGGRDRPAGGPGEPELPRPRGAA